MIPPMMINNPFSISLQNPSSTIVQKEGSSPNLSLSQPSQNIEHKSLEANLTPAELLTLTEVFRELLPFIRSKYLPEGFTGSHPLSLEGESSPKSCVNSFVSFCFPSS